MIWADEKRQIEKLTRKAKRAAIALLDHSTFPSEDKEEIGYAVAVAFERELTRVLNSYGTGPRKS